MGYHRSIATSDFLSGCSAMSSTTEEPSSVLNEGLTHPSRRRVLGRQDIVSFIFLTMVGATVTCFAAMGVSVVGW
jgi:hypothetical protein